jgi:hypothetical protein
MKKFLFLLIVIPVLFFTESKAQTELNSTQVDTLSLYLRPSTSRLTVNGTKNYATRLDTLQKAIGKFSANAPLTRIFMPTHSKSSFGTTTLVAGVKTVTNTAVTSTSKIIVFLITPGGTLGVQYYVSTITAGTSFIIKSAQTTGADQTSDTSTVGYVIIN